MLGPRSSPAAPAAVRRMNTVRRLLRVTRPLGPVAQSRVLTTQARLVAMMLKEKLRPDPEPTTATILGFEVTAANAWDLAFLFYEIFVLQEYHFTAGTDTPFIVDCGGNVGMATLYFKRLYPKADILVFEPDPDTFVLLERNMAANGLSDVRLVNAALFEEEGELDFFVDRSIAGGLVNSLNPHRATGEKLTVKGVRLSSYLDRAVDLLKLDVEGAEHAVMSELVSSGAIEHVRNLAMEYHHHIDSSEDRLGQMLALLEQHGFGYRLATHYDVDTAEGSFQDLSLNAYRKIAAAPTVAGAPPAPVA